MPNPIIRIHNSETDEVIDREMTDAEFAEHKKEAIEAQNRKKEADAKLEAKSVLLQKLGITEDEAKLLLA